MIDAFVRALEPHQLVRLIDAAEVELKRRNVDEAPEVVSEIAKLSGVPVSAILGLGRTAGECKARRLAAAALLGLGYRPSDIGRILRRDRATVRAMLKVNDEAESREMRSSKYARTA